MKRLPILMLAAPAIAIAIAAGCSAPSPPAAVEREFAGDPGVATLTVVHFPDPFEQFAWVDDGHFGFPPDHQFVMASGPDALDAPRPEAWNTAPDASELTAEALIGRLTTIADRPVVDIDPGDLPARKFSAGLRYIRSGPVGEWEPTTRVRHGTVNGVPVTAVVQRAHAPAVSVSFRYSVIDQQTDDGELEVVPRRSISGMHVHEEDTLDYFRAIVIWYGPVGPVEDFVVFYCEPFDRSRSIPGLSYTSPALMGDALWWEEDGDD